MVIVIGYSWQNKNIMKMKRIMMIIMAVALVALPTMAQGFRTQTTDEKVQTQAFQSTSTMKTSGSVYASQPALNADGTAYNPAQAVQSPAQAPSGPRKIGVVTPEDDPTPVGDAVLPLMLMALAFCGIVYYRRRKALNC